MTILAQPRPAILTLGLSALLAVSPSSSISLASLDEVLAHVQSSSAVAITAYTLTQNERITSDLAARGRDHRPTIVTLSSSAFGAAQKNNADVTAILHESGVSVRRSPEASHIKVALMDNVLYLADRNWARDSIIVRIRDTNGADLVARALNGNAGCDATLCTRKDLALRQEAEQLAEARGPLFFETESFDLSNPAVHALRQRIARGDAAFVMVSQLEESASPREDADLQTLLCAAPARVHVRIADSSDKFTLSGGSAWLGSTNATSPDNETGMQPDWGLRTTDATIVGALDDRFRQTWEDARALAPACR